MSTASDHSAPAPKSLREQLIAVADVFAAARGIGRKRLSTIVLNRGSKLDEIVRGADLATGTFEKAMAWFSANWPAGAAWPDGIERPAPDDLARETGEAAA